MNLRNLTIHKLNQPVSLATYIPDQTKGRANLETFYASRLQSNNTTVAEFLASSNLEGLLIDPYPALTFNSEEQNRYQGLFLCLHAKQRRRLSVKMLVSLLNPSTNDA